MTFPSSLWQNHKLKQERHKRDQQQDHSWQRELHKQDQQQDRSLLQEQHKRGHSFQHQHQHS